MFDFFRNNSRWIVLLLIFLVVPTIFFSGFYNDSSTNNKRIVSVGSSNITLSDFERSYSGFIEKVLSDTHNKIDISLLDTPDMRKNFLEELIDMNVLNQAVRDLKISVSDKTLRDYISSLDWGNGYNNFSRDDYLRTLSNIGIKPIDFEKEQRKYLSGLRLINSISFSPIIYDEIMNSCIKTYLQNRVVSIISYDYEKYRHMVTINDDEINSWYRQNKDSLEIPFNVNLDYLMIDKDHIANHIKLTKEDIDNYSNNIIRGEERRSFDYIFIELNELNKNDAIEKANDLLIKLSADPSKFSHFALKVINDERNSTIKSYFWNREELQNKYNNEFAEIVFSLKENQISKIIESSDGLYIVKLLNINYQDSLDIEKVKAYILEQKKNNFFMSVVEEIRDSIYEGNKDFAEIAADFNLKISNVDGLTRDGDIINSNTNSNANNLFKDIKVLNNIIDDFIENNRYYSILKISSSKYIAVKIKSSRNSFIPSLDSAKSKIIDFLTISKSRDLAIEDGIKYFNTLKSGKILAKNNKFPAPIKLSYKYLNNDIPGELLDFIMNMPFSSNFPVYGHIDLSSGFYIVKLINVEDMRDSNNSDIDFKKIFSEKYGNAESFCFMKSLREMYRIKLFDDVNDIMKIRIN